MSDDIPKDPNETGDRYFTLNNGGTAIVRPGGGTTPWLATWLPPDNSYASYPGFTLDSGFPINNGVDGVVMWITSQPWVNATAAYQPINAPPAEAPPADDPPAEAVPLDVPESEWTALRQKVRMDFAAVLAYSREPDGSYTWALVSEDGLVLQQGVADSWDDAKLGMIEHLYPPSDEDS